MKACQRIDLKLVYVQNVAIFGYSRSPLSDEDLRNLISERLTCRVDHA